MRADSPSIGAGRDNHAQGRACAGQPQGRPPEPPAQRAVSARRQSSDSAGVVALALPHQPAAPGVRIRIVLEIREAAGVVLETVPLVADMIVASAIDHRDIVRVRELVGLSMDGYASDVTCIQTIA